ncbi:hypothetical protein [Priestia megaterium]|uniref:hypothetical protein n=1 Tax=Priestia megaterium TaxID=1404 RepID=UPI00196B7264|nr:hypothetical protein [Priestia megaterium]QSF36958.1 hypothetical protein ICR96_15975 [Priestia megaterium]
MKGLIEYIQGERQQSTRRFRELMDKFREKKATINRNRDLSDSGRQKQITKLKAVYERKALELSHSMQLDGKKTALEVKKAAELFLLSEIPAVDSHKQALFNQKADQIEAAVKYAVTPKRAKEALDKLVELADEPGLAHVVKGKVLALSDGIIAMTTNPTARMEVQRELGRLFDDVSEKSMPEGSKEAKSIIETADLLLNSSGISPAVHTALREISIETSSFLDRPEERLAFLNAAELNVQDTKEEQATQSLQALAAKARQSGKMEDKLAYIAAKAALIRR